MEVRSILVNLDIDAFSPALVKCAADLARRFDAHLIGLAAAQPSPALVGIEGSVAMVGWYEQEREDIEKRLRSHAEQFHALVGTGPKVSWRSIIETPTRAVASSALCADLIVTGSRLGASSSNYQRVLNLGELILTAGRPVLAVGAGIDHVAADKIVVGWKDAREARRAIFDALPFLKTASDVVVTTISEGDLGAEKSGIDEVLSWLHQHDVKARGDVYPDQDGPASSIEAIGKSLDSDLIVTGGYGHSRLREWLFGGMTRDLLAASTRNRFMSN